MTFAQLTRILRAHLGLIAFTLIAVVSIVAVISLITPRRYVAASSIVIDFRGSNPIAANAMPAQLYPSYLATQLDIIASQNVALRVVDELKLMENPEARGRYIPAGGVLGRYVADWRDKAYNTPPNWLPQWMIDMLLGEKDDAVAQDETLLRYRVAEQLLKNLDLRPSRDSSVVKVGYSAADPSAAAEAANAFVQAYIATNLDLSVSPARDSSAWFNEQTKSLQSNLAKAREKYSEYQQRTGIVAAEEHLDVESARLVELSSRLVETQADNHPGIQALKSDLARAEANFNSLPPQLGPNHPQYRSAQEEVSILRSKLSRETQQISTAIQGQIASQRSKVLQMKRQRAELASLKGEVDNAQRALDDALQRSNQVRMESQINQTNVSILRNAVPPLKASSPNVPLNIAVSFVIAAIVAIGLALWRELAFRYVRGKEDLKRLLGVPVLGILPADLNASARRSLFGHKSAPHLTYNS